MTRRRHNPAQSMRRNSTLAALEDIRRGAVRRSSELGRPQYGLVALALGWACVAYPDGAVAWERRPGKKSTPAQDAMVRTVATRHGDALPA